MLPHNLFFDMAGPLKYMSKGPPTRKVPALWRVALGLGNRDRGTDTGGPGVRKSITSPAAVFLCQQFCQVEEDEEIVPAPLPLSAAAPPSPPFLSCMHACMRCGRADFSESVPSFLPFVLLSARPLNCCPHQAVPFLFHPFERTGPLFSRAGCSQLITSGGRAGRGLTF